MLFRSIKLLSTLLKYLKAKKDVTIDIVTGIIDSKNGRFVSCIGKIKKAVAKAISQIKNPYNAAFLNDFIFVNL